MRVNRPARTEGARPAREIWRHAPPENLGNLDAFSCNLVHYFTQNTAAETGTLLIGNDNSYLGSRTGGAPSAPPRSATDDCL